MAATAEIQIEVRARRAWLLRVAVAACWWLRWAIPVRWTWGVFARLAPLVVVEYRQPVERRWHEAGRLTFTPPDDEDDDGTGEFAAHGLPPEVFAR